MSTPPLSACVRTLLPAIVSDPERLPTLFAFESTVLEVAFILGPPLALGIGALWSTGAALAAAGVIMLASTLAFAAQPASRSWRPDPSVPRPSRRLGSFAGDSDLALIELATGAVFGATDVGVTAAAKALGSTAAAGPLLGLWGLGSLLGGIAATRLGGSARRAGGLVLLLGTLAVAHAALTLVTGSVRRDRGRDPCRRVDDRPDRGKHLRDGRPIRADRHEHRGVLVGVDGGDDGRGAGAAVAVDWRRARAPPRRSRSPAPPAGSRWRSRCSGRAASTATLANRAGRFEPATVAQPYAA